MSCLRFEFYHKGMLRNEVSLCLLMVYADSCGRLDSLQNLNIFYVFFFCGIKLFLYLCKQFYDKKHLALLPVSESNFHKSVY